jgi:hypothetical protein
MLIHRPPRWEGFPRRRVPLLLADRPNTCAAGTPEYETVLATTHGSSCSTDNVNTYKPPRHSCHSVCFKLLAERVLHLAERIPVP